jgi:molecular chaperone DnaK
MRIVNHFVDEFKKESGIDVKEDKAAMQRLKKRPKKPKKNFLLLKLQILTYHS